MRRAASGGLLSKIVTAGGRELNVTLYEGDRIGEVERTWIDGVHTVTEQFKYVYDLLPASKP